MGKIPSSLVKFALSDDYIATLRVSQEKAKSIVESATVGAALCIFDVAATLSSDDPKQNPLGINKLYALSL
jgi:hypothetical protein